MKQYVYSDLTDEDKAALKELVFGDYDIQLDPEDYERFANTATGSVLLLRIRLRHAGQEIAKELKLKQLGERIEKWLNIHH